MEFVFHVQVQVPTLFQKLLPHVRLYELDQHVQSPRSVQADRVETRSRHSSRPIGKGQVERVEHDAAGRKPLRFTCCREGLSLAATTASEVTRN